jgi:hypothetical protein
MRKKVCVEMEVFMLNPGVSSTNTNINNRTRTAPERKVGSMSNYTTRTPAHSLSTGQIIRGEITDLRNNEITLTLEDNTQVTGQLSESANFSIGERAAFLITNIQPDKISLEIVKNSLQSSEQITIHKALEEAGLPANEKNKSIVRELLKNNMPIHKQSIMNILTQSYQFKDVSIPTLTAMNRLGLEITDETAARFEDCRTHENTLSSEASSLASSIKAGFQEASSPEDAEFVRTLLSMTEITEEAEDDSAGETAANPVFSYGQPQTSLTGGLSGIFRFQRLSSLLSSQQQTAASPAPAKEDSAAPGMVTSSEKEELTGSISSFTESQKSVLKELTQPEKPMNPMAFYQKPANVSEELQSLIDRLDQFSEKSSQALSEDVSLRDAISLMQEAQTLADDIDFYQIGQARNHFMEKHPDFSALLEENTDNPEFEQLSARLEEQLSKVPSSSSLLSSSLTEQLEQRYSQYLDDKGTIASVLTTDELEELTAQSKQFPFRPEFQERLLDGDVTAKEFLTEVKNTASLADNTALLSLTGTPAFGKLFEQEFLASFSLRPKDLATPGKTEEFFDKTYQKLRDISDTLAKQQSTSEHSGSFAQADKNSDNMQKHLEFLKSFNELFTYVPIPAQLKNRTMTGDLYVYTRKDRLREHPEDASVLLHLNMDNLGPLDIHLSMHHANVNSRIYCDNSDIKKFLTSQIPSLKTALSLKGYFLDASIEEREKPFDFVQDFIQKKTEPKTASEKPGIKRYTFDIRA